MFFSLIKTGKEAGNAVNGQKKLSFDYTSNVHTAAAVYAPQNFNIHKYGVSIHVKLSAMFSFHLFSLSHACTHSLTHFVVYTYIYLAESVQ